ncbi:hypothetical protein AB0F91_37850 [Amycolatopsis sp. NPDC023774]|uniref:hypothetical protein n=1 Tax=Amycolatopsis sp. NPDC023774 TaxID=3155015 RepID=UPI003411781C
MQPELVCVSEGESLVDRCRDLRPVPDLRLSRWPEKQLSLTGTTLRLDSLNVRSTELTDLTCLGFVEAAAVAGQGGGELRRAGRDSEAEHGRGS